MTRNLCALTAGIILGALLPIVTGLVIIELVDGGRERRR